MKDDAKCFIKTKNNEYEQITYKILQKRRKNNIKYRSKKFIPLYGMLLEVPPEEYKDFYKAIERNKYIKKEEIRVKTISIDAISNSDDDFIHKDVINDKNVNIEFEVERKEEISNLQKALSMLDESDYKLIKSLFYDERTIREYANILGIPFTTIQNRKNRILKKLKEILKNL